MYMRICFTLSRIAMVFGICCLFSGAPSEAQTPGSFTVELPAGEGKAQVQTLCAVCHDLERVVSQKKSPEAWRVTVEDMLERISPDMVQETAVISDYLASHYGMVASNVLGQVLASLNRGDVAAANSLARENVDPLREELDKILAEMDRGFDELGRQKARYDVLQGKFTQFQATWMAYEPAFRLFSSVTDHAGYMDHFRAKRLRVEGAGHTTSADHFWDIQDYDRALREYSEGTRKLREAIPLAESAGDRKLVAACLTNIGYNEIYSGNSETGLEVYTQALEIAEQRQDEIFQGMYLLNLGTFHLYTMQSEKALEYALRAAEMTAKIRRRTWEANALLNVGASYLSLRKLEEAGSYLQKAFLKAEEAKDRRSHGRILYNLALNHSLLGRTADAAGFMADAIEWYRNNPIVYGESENTVLQYQGARYLAGAYHRLNDPEKSKRYADQASEVMSRDPQKLAAYLVDPHLNFMKWDDFKKEHGLD